MFKFKQLIELWKKDNLLTEAIDVLNTMFGSVHDMYAESVRSLRESGEGEMKFDVYDMDEHVNTFELQVRRKVLMHLSITGATNVGPGLILANIVSDVEDIGDATKEIMDLASAHPERLACSDFEEEVERIESAMANLFEETGRAFKESDNEAAEKLVKDSLWILKSCDGISDSLLRQPPESLQTRDGVAIALYARYLRNIAEHLINIASSVVSPFHQMGFVSSDGESYAL